MRICLGIATTVALLALSATTGAGSRAGTPMHWTIDGVQRAAIVFAPAPTTTGAVKHPLVFAFHGHGGNAQVTAMQMHLQTVWPQAIVLYPQGLNSPSPLDPSATKPGWQFKSGDSNNRDLKLFDAMVATLKRRYQVDPSAPARPTTRLDQARRAGRSARSIRLPAVTKRPSRR
jgi:polyhydroxybutyrate depolymerase